MIDAPQIEDQEVEDQDVDAELEAAFAEREKRRGKEPPPAAPESPQAESEDEPSAEVQPEAKDDPEPFEGYSALPESVRAKWDEINKKAAEADRIAAEHQKLQNNYNALHNRLAPTQRELEQLKRQTQQRPQAKPEALKWDDWLKTLDEEGKSWAKEFPEEARNSFRAAQSVAAAMFKSGEDRLNSTISELKKQAEIDRLSAKHEDWRDFIASNDPSGAVVPHTQKGADYWAWVSNQPPEIQALANGNAAQEVAAALDVYKWEKQHPEYQQVISHPAFAQWIDDQPSVYRSVIHSANVNDRVRMWEKFIADYDRSQAPADTTRADQVAARRDKQARNISPSVRSNVAPASTAAASGEDAEIEAAYQLRKQHLSKRQ